jgi:hypothetical protein
MAVSVFLAACGGGGGSGDGTQASSATNAAKSSASVAASSAASADTASSSSTSASTSTSTSTTAAATSGDTASASVTTTTTATTATSTASTAKLFYGANGHNNEGGAYDLSSTALQLQQLQDLGAKLYRNEVYSPGTANKLARIAATMAAGGVTVYPVMLMGLDFNSEDDAYAAGFALGQATATAYKFPYYEVTNELEADALTGNVDGVYPSQYDNDKFMHARGVIRGMIAGVKSIDPAAKIVMGGGAWMHYAFDQMLANGTQPDGTTGHPVVDWDITAWHWYSDQGDITKASGGTGIHNVLAALKALGKPIWMNEVGVRPWYGSDQQIADYLVGNLMMAQLLALASTYNIQSIQAYELYDDPPGGEGAYGLLKNDGVTPKAAYTTYKQFVAANPR